MDAFLRQSRIIKIATTGTMISDFIKVLIGGNLLPQCLQVLFVLFRRANLGTGQDIVILADDTTSSIIVNWFLIEKYLNSFL
jgi:hypothetical protein